MIAATRPELSVNEVSLLCRVRIGQERVEAGDDVGLWRGRPARQRARSSVGEDRSLSHILNGLDNGPQHRSHDGHEECLSGLLSAPTDQVPGRV
jgi:hypothetical protein